MHILMLGWEFPPMISGGLGAACDGLTKALGRRNVRVTFVLPTGDDPPPALPADLPNVTFKAVRAKFRSPYPAPTQAPFTPSRPPSAASVVGGPAGYGGDLTDQARRYAHHCVRVARDMEVDLIHAHDWLTYPAGIAVARVLGRPWIAHLHSSEFDRAGAGADPAIVAIERRGLHAATRVICVSRFTARQVEQRFGVNPARIDVVHNGIDLAVDRDEPTTIDRTDKVVLFLGRITMQKGPEFFLAAARKVLQRDERIKFIVAGAGDQAAEMVEQVARSGLGHKVLFTGFLTGDEVRRVFKMADVYVMPSVSEPFGIAALEAMSHHVPVILSRTAGVGEAVRHVLRVDFWDTDDIANKVLGVLHHPPVGEEMARRANAELGGLTWDDAARRCVTTYEQALKDASPRRRPRN